jgi:hypothetical protein
MEMNSAAPFAIMCLVSLMLGIDVIILTTVLHDLLVAGGSKSESAVGFMMTYVTHLIAFIGMCYATYKVHEAA